MTTLTALEDRLRAADGGPDEWVAALAQARTRLDRAMMKPASREQYKEFTLLREAVVQAEDIIHVIYFRYHNSAINVPHE